LPIRWVAAADDNAVAAYTQPPADAFWDVTVTVPPLSIDEAMGLLKRRTEEEFDIEIIPDMLDAAKGSPRQLVQLARLALRDQAFPSKLRAARDDQAALVGALGRPPHML